MRSTFAKVGLVILVLLAGMLVAHRVHRRIVHRVRTFPAARAPRTAVVRAAPEESRSTTLLFAERFVQDRSFVVRALDTGMVEATTAELADWVSTQLTVRVDFYQPAAAGVPAADHFAPGNESRQAWRWPDILLVDALPGPAHTNAARSRFQIRARVEGPAPILRAATGFPVRIYRTFANEPDDGDAEFANAFRQLFGAAETNAAGHVVEPEGQVVLLRRVAEAGSNTVIFASDVLDLCAHPELDPARNRLPASFAVFDSDALFSQYREKPGDEEPDGWAFAHAMTASGFVSAGLAHPKADVFASGRAAYQLALALGDKAVLNFPAFADYETPPPATRAKLRVLPAALQPGGALHALCRNLGASKVLGRPVSNGPFIVSTGVQKLVVTARGRARNGDTDWRLPGLVQALDGTMDQCLVRAPAPVFVFSGHGWDMKNHWREGDHLQILNSFTGKNPSMFSRREYLTYLVADPPPRRWNGFAAGALPENKIILAEKWRRDEVRLQWVFFLGCYVLDSEGNPFEENSNANIFGRLIVDRLGAKGVIGFAAHGFTSASFLERFVRRARQQPVPAAWMGIWNDDEAKAYTWYEQNEEYGRSYQRCYQPDIQQMMPAYVVRQENAGETLTPENVEKPASGSRLRFGFSAYGARQEYAGEFRARK